MRGKPVKEPAQASGVAGVAASTSANVVAQLQGSQGQQQNIQQVEQLQQPAAPAASAGVASASASASTPAPAPTPAQVQQLPPAVAEPSQAQIQAQPTQEQKLTNRFAVTILAGSGDGAKNEATDRPATLASNGDNANGKYCIFIKLFGNIYDIYTNFCFQMKKWPPRAGFSLVP